MILVNDPGSWSHIYPPLEHAQWNGWTPTDLIFPFFLFIAGISMTLSFAARLQRGQSPRQLSWHVLRRSTLIFAIGLFLNGFPDFDLHTIRIPGVLQRIAVCYLIAGCLYLWLQRPAAAPATHSDTAKTRTIIASVAAGLLLGYWALMTLVPVPGAGAGHLTPQDNLGAYVDRMVLHDHLWSESKTWDPEGLLSTLPAIATVLLGILTGDWLRRRKANARGVAELLGWGCALLLAGALWGRSFPINKNLWTSSFVLFTAGAALLVFALCYWTMDMRGWRSLAAPLLPFGTNAIFAYALAAIVSEVSTDFEFSFSDGREQTLHGWIYQRWFVPHASANNASLAFGLFFVLCIFVCVWPLYRRKIFIRL